jgi:hypothetical protein
VFAVVVRTGVVLVVFERHVLCAFGGQVSEARVECTFLANDAAYLTLSRAVTQLRRSEIVTPGVGLAVCVVIQNAIEAHKNRPFRWETQISPVPTYGIPGHHLRRS